LEGERVCHRKTLEAELIIRQTSSGNKKDLVVYVHGKDGSTRESEHYKALFTNHEIIGFDYFCKTPWDAKKEFFAFFAAKKKLFDHIVLIANSIGAFFAFSSLDENLVDVAYLISPIVDIESLIYKMMQRSNITEKELAEKREISTAFG